MFNSSMQSLAAAALSHLPTTTDHLPRPSGQSDPLMTHYIQSAPVSEINLVKNSAESAAPTILPDATGCWQQQANTGDTGEIKPANLEDQRAMTPTPQPTNQLASATTSEQGITGPLPSLLRYVDNHLLRRRSEWNNPPSSNLYCWVCHKIHYGVTVPSACYLPLTCGCWMHYHCFIEHVVTAKINERRHAKDCCPICGVRLFTSEGIAMLTLATRTHIPMADMEYLFVDSYYDQHTAHHIRSDSTAYSSDCHLIETTIHKRFGDLFTPLSHRPVSPYVDGSPDLRACYYAILGDLDRHRCPKSRWLSFSRDVAGSKYNSVGFFLFGMLVTLKMRRYMNQHHAAIVETEGWADFENSREELQRMILKEVRGDGWSWGISRPSVAAP